MSERAYIAVTLSADGKTPQRTLVYEGKVVGELGYLDTVGLIEQASRTLRYEPRHQKPAD